MKQIRGWVVLGLACCLVAGVALGAPEQAGESAQARHLLRALSERSADGYPDQHGEYEGLLRYERGDYAGAMRAFLAGARYADKTSQLCIGLMYLNGLGVAKDPVRAYAWVEVAAERRYPSFLATRDRIWAGLDASQRTQALALAAKLRTDYGDAAAEPRMAAVLGQSMLHATGSMLGFEPFVRAQSPGQFFGDRLRDSALATAPCTHAACAAPWVEPAPRWTRPYFRSRDSAWLGTVTVEPLQRVDALGTKTQ